MANIPIIENHEKSRELFTKATKIIPSGVYGHLGPAEGQFIPVSNWPLFLTKAKGSYMWVPAWSVKSHMKVCVPSA